MSTKRLTQLFNERKITRMKSSIPAKAIITEVGIEFETQGNLNITINGPASLQNPKPESLFWISPKKEEKESLINSLPGGIIICNGSVKENLVDLKNKLLLIHPDPRLAFAKSLRHFFTPKSDSGVHPSSTIHPKAKLGKNVSIGPNCYVGESEIGDNTVIDGNVFIYDNIRIGRNNRISANTVIGGDGFGYVKEGNESFKIPHLGGVIIGDYVEIGSSTCIDRGTLDDTIIENHVKIDNLVHVAHNVFIGEGSYIIANTMIGGSTVIHKNTWIAPSVSILNQISIGENVVVGMNAVVTKNIPDNETWAGIPAMNLNDYKERLKKLKSL